MLFSATGRVTGLGAGVRLILAEDSQRLQELLAEALQRAGHCLDIVTTADALLAGVQTASYDLIIVDLGLPDGEGLDAIRTMRAAGISSPILIITARSGVDDRVAGLDSGADDYLVKPFNHAEFLARVRALLRRTPALQAQVLRRGNIELDQLNDELRCSGQLVDLRLSERRLLAVLMRRNGVVAKASLEEMLGGFGRERSSNAIEVLVSRLRKVLDDHPSGITIETVRGVGYRLREEVQP
jgi:DNA-binding response OmpR family regulator